MTKNEHAEDIKYYGREKGKSSILRGVESKHKRSRPLSERMTRKEYLDQCSGKSSRTNRDNHLSGLFDGDLPKPDYRKWFAYAYFKEKIVKPTKAQEMQNEVGVVETIRKDGITLKRLVEFKPENYGEEAEPPDVNPPPVEEVPTAEPATEPIPDPHPTQEVLDLEEVVGVEELPDDDDDDDDVIADPERLSELEAGTRTCLKYYDPKDEYEGKLVADIAVAHWRLDSILEMEREILLGKAVPALDQLGKSLLAYRESAERSLRHALSMLEIARKVRR